MIAAFLCAHCVSPVPPVVQLLTFPRPPRISLRAATALVTLDFSSRGHPSLQKNLHSSSYQSGRYSVKQEKGLYAFHQMYRELVP